MRPIVRTRYIRSARSLTPKRLGGSLLVLLAVVLGGTLLGGQGASAPAGAAPGSWDGLSQAVLSRDAVPASAVAAQDVPRQAAMVAAGQVGAPDGAAAPPARSAPRVSPSSDLSLGEFYVHVPPNVDGRLKVLVALHGIGGEARQFCEAILDRADREQWVVVAPTYAYGDWRDPAQVAREESSRLIPRLHQFLQELPAHTGLDVEPRAALYGFSRGAQLAQRFAIVYPEQTHAVAAFSAGSYTLPTGQAEVDGQSVPLPYPFGTADLRERFGRPLDSAALQRIPFLVGVGAEDRNPSDLPRHWDPYLGSNRLARAEAFTQRLGEMGVRAELAVFPGVGHNLNEIMQARALDFLARSP
jgi:predicted esterase